MTRRALLAAVPWMAACKRTPTNARVDPALAPLIPADSLALAGIRLDLLRKTSLWQSLFPPNAPSVLSGLAERTGIDIADDLYEVVYCLGGRHRLILIRGKFTDGGIANSGLEPELKIPGGQKLPYKGFILQGREDAAVVFFNSSVALAGRAAALRDAIDSRNDKRPLRSELLRLVESLPYTAHAYLVSDKPALPEGGIGGLKSVPFRLASLQAYLQVEQNISLRVQGQSDGEKGAQEVVASLRGILSMLSLSDPKSPVVAALRSLQIGSEGAQVVLQGEFPLEAMQAAVRGMDNAE